MEKNTILSYTLYILYKNVVTLFSHLLQELSGRLLFNNIYRESGMEKAEVPNDILPLSSPASTLAIPPVS